jgi:hypothetical protein
VPSGFVDDVGEVEALVEALGELPHPAARRANPTKATSVDRLAAIAFLNIMCPVSLAHRTSVCS